MEGYVATALHSFVGQSLLQRTERIDIFPTAEHQRRVALVAWFLEGTLKREQMRGALRELYSLGGEILWENRIGRIGTYWVMYGFATRMLRWSKGWKEREKKKTSLALADLDDSRLPPLIVYYESCCAQNAAKGTINERELLCFSSSEISDRTSKTSRVTEQNMRQSSILSHGEEGCARIQSMRHHHSVARGKQRSERGWERDCIKFNV